MMTEDTAITMVMLVILFIGGIGLFFEILGTPRSLVIPHPLVRAFPAIPIFPREEEAQAQGRRRTAKLLGTDAHLAVLEKIDS
jgi:hypothetical protein